MGLRGADTFLWKLTVVFFMDGSTQGLFINYECQICQSTFWAYLSHFRVDSQPITAVSIEYLIIACWHIQKRRMVQNDLCVTFKSAPNIALVKYWGKYSESEIIPLNDSIGLTLDTDDLSSRTTVTFSQEGEQDTFVLNQKNVGVNNRMAKVLRTVRERVRVTLRFKEMSQQQWSKFHFKVVSENTFPSASGMASSASGFSCLAAALNHLFGGIFSKQELSRLARSGSGSASRALFGGLVRWLGIDEKYFTLNKSLSAQNTQQASLKSISFPVLSSKDLSFIRVIALITQNKEKEVSSTVGMRTSMQTSEFIKQRREIANKRIEEMTALLKGIGQFRAEGDKGRQYQTFGQFTELIIKDSNSFHAVCLDTYPPIFYLNEFSRQIISMVDNIINKQTGRTKVAYTFDAGPHGFLFVHEDMLEDVLLYLYGQFGSNPDTLNPKAKKILGSSAKSAKQFCDYGGVKINPRGIWVTEVGLGAERVPQ